MADPPGPPPPARSVRNNLDRWRQQDYVSAYANRWLHPAERTVIERFRSDLAGRVLELGSGAGRLTGHLIEVGREVHGLDISHRMVEHAQHAYPRGHFRQGDARDLSAYADGSFDAVTATDNMLDVFDDAERRRVLDGIARIVRPDGLFLMSAHNRAYAPRVRRPTRVLSRRPREALERIVRFPVRYRNHRRLRPLERSEPNYAIINDDAHDYSMLMYYIDVVAQGRQLDAHGFEVLHVLDGSGAEVAPGDPAADHPHIHYVTRRRSAPTPPG